MIMKDLIEAIHDLFVLEFGEGLSDRDREIYESVEEPELKEMYERLKVKYLV